MEFILKHCLQGNPPECHTCQHHSYFYVSFKLLPFFKPDILLLQVSGYKKIDPTFQWVDYVKGIGIKNIFSILYSISTWH